MITTIAQIERQAWTDLVTSSPTATWFQTPEAWDFYTSLPEQMIPFDAAVLRDGVLKGLIIGYVTKEKSRFRQFFTRRALVLGGPLLAEDITDAELTDLVTEINRRLRRKAIYVETRSFVNLLPWREVLEACGWYYQPHYDMYIDCADRQKMFDLIHDSKKRQIRKAEKEGVRIVEATTKQEVHDFYFLLRRLYRNKVHRPLFTESFFQRFVADKRGVLLVAKQGNTVLGGILCPILPGKAIYEWYLVGPAIVTWSAMDYASTHGIPLFDLMGAGSPDQPYSVRDFKQQMGGRIIERGRFLCVNNRPLYNLGKFVVKNILK